MKKVVIIVLLLFLGIALYLTSMFAQFLLENGTDALRNFDLGKIVEREVTNQRVVEEESAVIEVVENTSASVVSIVERSVVFDFFSGPEMQEGTIGTGFAVSATRIVTNRHVVDTTNATYLVVDNDGNEYEVEEIIRDDFNDLAIINLKSGNFTPLELGDADSVKVGQTVIAIGNALGRFTNSVTKGVISGIGRGITAGSSFGRYQRLDNVLQTDAALNPGNSGGPLLNLSGQVIGVNVATGQGSENIGFAIPIDALRDFITSVEDGTVNQRAFLGVSYQMIDRRVAGLRDLVEGAFVQEVVSGSPAADAGIRVGDIITKIGDETLTVANDLRSVVVRLKPGDKVKIAVWRTGNTLEVETTLTSAE